VGDEQHPVPWPSCSSAISFRISACVVTSSAVVGSFGDQQDGIEHQRHGDHDALALAARSWCG